MRRDEEDIGVRYESYLVRVWHDVPKRFVVENVQTGQKQGFVSWARLEAWLEEHFGLEMRDGEIKPD